MPSDFDFNDLNVPFEKSALEKLQCNVLRSTGRPRSTQIFHRFKTKEEFAAWLAEKAPSPSSSTADHDPLVNVMFTYQGLKMLGFAEEKLRRMDPAFVRGSRDDETREMLGDGESADWREHEAPWHVVELHAHDERRDIVSPATGNYTIEIGTGIDEYGNPVTKRDVPSHGHFGILDGISKPVYTQKDYDALPYVPRDEWAWDPRRKLSTLVVRDILTESRDAFGSYFVFRKYKQDKAAFQKRLEEIADEIKERRRNKDPELTLSPELRGFRPFQGQVDGDLTELIIQWIFGRGSKGATAFGHSGNDFELSSDSEGTVCPFHAHISKMNPRGRTGDPEFERTKTVARRGTSYTGTDIFPGANAGREHRQETGLLFWCAQASIGDQFEFVQRAWANSSDDDFDREPTPDVDTVIGKPEPQLFQAVAGELPWKKWKSTSDIDYNIWGTIKLVGAEYLYAPSLEGFQALRTHARRLLKETTR